jgi:hypothetical protein
MEWDDYLRQQAATYSSTWQTSAKRSPTTSRIVFQAGKWHEPISHSARRAQLQPASEEANGVLLDGNGNIVRERCPGKPVAVERSPLLVLGCFFP